jgi:hypothetical protein
MTACTERIALRTAWRVSDPQIERDVKAFWQRLARLGTTEAERRVSELCAAAYSGESLIGIATAYLDQLDPLRARFAFFRCLVVPRASHNEIARQLATLSRDQLERWSFENPNEQVLGMAAVVPGNRYGEERRDPVWSWGGLTLNLVGYTRTGEQVRISWFRHARVSDSAVSVSVHLQACP